MDKIFIDEVISDLHTIYDMIRWTVSRFSAAGIHYGHGTDNPWDEAVQLILPTLFLSLDIPEYICHARLTNSERNLIIDHVIRRVRERIPISYLTNKAWFCGHELYVDHRVLIPRSLIGELIEKKFSSIITEQPRNILDMCTGSGCIAIACAYVFPEAKIDAVDISNDALAVACKNVKLHQLSDNISLIRGDLFRDLPKVEYDLIIANPPYVDVRDMAHLPKEYSYEPELGLISGSDGLKIIRRILACAANYLSHKGVLICEVGDSNMKHIIEQYAEVFFIWLEFDNGGDGVFMITRENIFLAQHHFVFYKD